MEKTKMYKEKASYYEGLDKRTKEYKDYIEWKDSNQSQGIGDDITKVLNSKHVKPITDAVKSLIWDKGEDCGCDKRAELLNKWFPKRKVKCLTEKEYKFLADMFKKNSRSLKRNDNVMLYSIYNRVFNDSKKATSCGSCVKSVMTTLKRVMKSYELDKGNI